MQCKVWFELYHSTCSRANLAPSSSTFKLANKLLRITRKFFPGFLWSKPLPQHTVVHFLRHGGHFSLPNAKPPSHSRRSQGSGGINF